MAKKKEEQTQEKKRTTKGVKTGGKGRPRRPKGWPKHMRMDGEPKKGYTAKGTKTAAALKDQRKKAAKRRKNGPKNKQLSTSLKAYWKGISAAERRKRALKIWRKRYKLYGKDKGYTQKPSGRPIGAKDKQKRKERKDKGKKRGSRKNK